MPLIKIKKKPDYVYGIWKIEESIEFLYKDLVTTAQERDYLNKISHLERNKQSIAAKLILNNLANQKLNYVARLVESLHQETILTKPKQIRLYQD